MALLRHTRFIASRQATTLTSIWQQPSINKISSSSLYLIPRDCDWKCSRLLPRRIFDRRNDEGPDLALTVSLFFLALAFGSLCQDNIQACHVVHSVLVLFPDCPILDVFITARQTVDYLYWKSAIAWSVINVCHKSFWRAMLAHSCSAAERYQHLLAGVRHRSRHAAFLNDNLCVLVSCSVCECYDTKACQTCFPIFTTP